jgi:hypothetical protein
MLRITMGILVIAMLLAGCNGSDGAGLAAAPTTQQAVDATNALAVANQALALAQQTAADLQAIPSPTTQQASDLVKAEADIKTLQTAVAAIPPVSTETPEIQQVTAGVGAVAGAIPTPYSAYIAAGAGLLLLLERIYQNYQAGGTGSAIAGISSTITQAAQDIATIAATQNVHGQAIATLVGNSVSSTATPSLTPKA